MPDPSTPLGAGQAGFSRVCPSCGRRVPRSIDTCRCGAALPAVEPVPLDAPAAEPSSGKSPLIAIVVLVFALAGGSYWMFLRPLPQDSAVAARSEASGATEAEPASRLASPEARAWDAAANAAITPGAASTAAPLAGARPAPAPPAGAASIEEMVDSVMPAVVLIQTTTGRGSGFFVRHDTLITNVHVVQNDGYVTLRKSDGSTVNARVESRAPAFDIAILKVAQPSPSQVVIPLGTSQSLRPGQEVVVIGSALGTLQNSVSRGIVSALRTSGGATLVQTDAATNPGNSGGPMLDRHGSAIGITTMGYRNAEGLNFGVAIDHARDLLEGRQVNLGTQSGLSNIQSLAGSSESDRRQQQGEEQFTAAAAQLGQAAGQIDAAWRRFRAQCFTSVIPGSYNREWFAVLVPRGIPDDAAAGCISYYQSMEGEIKKFHGLMRGITAEARRASVLPGTIRDVLRTNRLDFDWER